MTWFRSRIADFPVRVVYVGTRRRVPVQDLIELFTREC